MAEKSQIELELEEENDNGGLSELDFNDYYQDETTSDQERDLEDYYAMLEDGVDDSQSDEWEGFQIHSVDESEEEII